MSVSTVGIRTDLNTTNSNPIAAVNDFIRLADEDINIPKKREHYQSAFKILQKHVLASGNTLEVEKSLFELFEIYATKTCYGQVGKDGEEGFRKSARLMELALCMQLKTLDLGGIDYEWTKFNDLEELIQSLETQPDQEGKFFPLIDQLKIDPTAALQKAAGKGLCQSMAKTLIRMTFSHQNISTLINPEKYNFHHKFNCLTVELIGKETIEQRRELVNYQYNRCAFLSGLESHGDWKAKLKSYQPVIEDIKTYLMGDFVGNSLIAQILNMQSLITLRSNSGPMRELHEQTYPFLVQALELRKKLIEECKDDVKLTDQKFLLSNIRTSLIDNLVSREPLTEEVKKLALEHAFELKKCLLEREANGIFHQYHQSWQKAIDKTIAFA